jgi:Ca-activated chloride channel family protein
VRRLAGAVLALVLLAAAPAEAQDRGDPVVGGGSFNSAPILEPGRYHDTILPGEYLYYGFRLAAGQKLRVEATHPDIDNEDVRRLGVIFLSANIHSPTRARGSDTEQPGDHPFIGFGNFESEPLIVTSPEAQAAEDDSTDGGWASAGVYYLALHAVWRSDGKRPKAEIPFTFAAEVTGAAQPNATPSATPTPTATATRTPTPAPRAEEADAGPSAAVAAIGGVGGILLGVVVGIARRGRRR